MRKSAIREAVSAYLAEMGYSNACYGWPRPGWLEVYNPRTMRCKKFNLPAIRKFTMERLTEELTKISRIGPPQALNARVSREDGGGNQLDLIDWLGDRREP